MKSVDELAEDCANGLSANDATGGLRACVRLGFKCGHASRESEIAEKDARIKELETSIQGEKLFELNSANYKLLQQNQSLESKLKICVEAFDAIHKIAIVGTNKESILVTQIITKALTLIRDERGGKE